MALANVVETQSSDFETLEPFKLFEKGFYWLERLNYAFVTLDHAEINWIKRAYCWILLQAFRAHEHGFGGGRTQVGIWKLKIVGKLLKF